MLGKGMSGLMSKLSAEKKKAEGKKSEGSAMDDLENLNKQGKPLKEKDGSGNLNPDMMNIKQGKPLKERSGNLNPLQITQGDWFIGSNFLFKC
jgi:hypothetical protein